MYYVHYTLYAVHRTLYTRHADNVNPEDNLDNEYIVCLYPLVICPLSLPGTRGVAVFMRRYGGRMWAYVEAWSIPSSTTRCAMLVLAISDLNRGFRQSSHEGAWPKCIAQIKGRVFINLLLSATILAGYRVPRPPKTK